MVLVMLVLLVYRVLKCDVIFSQVLVEQVASRVARLNMQDVLVALAKALQTRICNQIKSVHLFIQQGQIRGADSELAPSLGLRGSSSSAFNFDAWVIINCAVR